MVEKMLTEDCSLFAGSEEVLVPEGECVSGCWERKRKQARLVSHWISEMVGGDSWDGAAGFGLAKK